MDFDQLCDNICSFVINGNIVGRGMQNFVQVPEKHLLVLKYYLCISCAPCQCFSLRESTALSVCFA